MNPPARERRSRDTRPQPAWRPPRHAVRFGAAGVELPHRFGRETTSPRHEEAALQTQGGFLFLASKRAFPQVRRYEEAIQPKYALSLSKDFVLEKVDFAILWKCAG